MNARPEYQRYRPRPIRFTGIRDHAGYRLRCHEVAWRDRPLDLPRFEEGIDLILQELPQPAVSGGRPGLGFLIAHQGATGDYLVLGWWDNENELPMKVWVRHPDDGWGPAGERESFCVWDLEVMWRERERYVAAMLAGPESPGPDAYLWGEAAASPER